MHQRITPYLSLALLSFLSACGGSKRTSPAYSAHTSGGSPASAESVGAGESYSDDSGYAPAEDAERPGLGTTFGEQVESRVRERSFERATEAPFAEATVYYNDQEGVLAQARYHGAELREISTRSPGGGIHIRVADIYQRPLRGFAAAGKTYVVGHDGDRYVLVLENTTGGTYEVVASVDGLDVIDGQSAGFHKRGYIIAPHSTLVIDGFRTSTDTVAAFRFGSVSESYAARTGSDRNVGVIGFAFFAERGSAWTTDELHRRETADPFPSRYARPPGSY